jgi:hypothetical protein
MLKLPRLHLLPLPRTRLERLRPLLPMRAVVTVVRPLRMAPRLRATSHGKFSRATNNSYADTAIGYQDTGSGS